MPRGVELQKMHEDLKKALNKPVEERGWIMVINVKKCIGCNACRVACISENVSPPGVFYRTVPEVEEGEYPKVSRLFMPTQCMQCDKPPCISAAPAGAMTKRQDGIVAINYAKFRGKQAFEKAAKACPYARALYYDDGRFFTRETPSFQPYEKAVSFEYGDKWSRASNGPPVGSARKCHFCLHRLNAGMLPACIGTCVGGACYFGDNNDSASLVSQLLRTYESMRINESSGTEPRVYYLVSDKVVAYNLQTCLACHR